MATPTPSRFTAKIPAYGVLAIPTFFFLLPCLILKVSSLCGLTFSRFGVGLFRRRNANLFAARLILLSSQRMIHAINAASKLCADIRTTLRSCGLQPPAFAQLARRGETPLRCILPRCRKRHVETLPVSTPSGLRRPVAYPSWAVCP
jgi:hypothetical protein